MTVGFTVEHGCEGSATTQLDMRLPAGVVDAVVEPVEDWEGAVETVDGDTIVTFVGGPLPDDVEGTFAVTMTLPPAPDVTIYFPFVQRCEVGEIRWIGIPAEPGDELDEPAPAMDLTSPVATTSAPTDSTEPATTEPSATTEPTVTTEPATTQPSATSAEPDPSDTVAIVVSDDEVGNSATGTVAFIVTMAVVFALGGFVAYRSRQARAATAADAG